MGQILQAWSPKWEGKFKHESSVLRQILVNEVIEIHHIGGTSNRYIPYSKPILDILIIVDNITRVDWYNKRFLKFGYYAKGENGIQGRRYFVKGVTRRTHHVHIYEYGDDTITDMLTLNQYLQNHASIAAEFGGIKRELANRFSHHIKAYEREKEPYIERLLHKSIHWASKERKKDS